MGCASACLNATFIILSHRGVTGVKIEFCSHVYQVFKKEIGGLDFYFIFCDLNVIQTQLVSIVKKENRENSYQEKVTLN